MKKKNKPKSILLFSNQLIRNIEPLIAKQIKEKLKFRAIFVAKTKQDAKFYKDKFKNCYDEVYNNKYKINITYIKYHKKYKNPEEVALKLEKKYNISILRLFFNDRVLGRGFFGSGGVRHPRNTTHEHSNHKDLLNMAINFITFWEDTFHKENVKLALNLCPISHQLAIKNNIEAYRLFEGKFKNTFSWIEHSRLDPKISIKDLKKIKIKKPKVIEIKKPYQSYLNARNVDIEKLKLVNTLKSILHRTLSITYGKIKGYEKSKNKFILDEALYLWCMRSSYVDYLKKVNVKLENVKGKKFIFFPLLSEPETGLHGSADDFFFQLSAINLISRDLPADYLLVVKEHIIAFGRRPKDFYDQINDLANVVLANPTELGLDYIKESKAVACITGTAGWEASVMGIPVLSFSENNTWNFLNHVYLVNNFADLRPIFLSIEKENFPNKKSTLQGANFYKAYFKKLIEVNNYNNLVPLSSDLENIPAHMKDVANKIFLGLIKKMKDSKQ